MVNARGYLFISLNAVRFLSIVGLILLFSSSIVAMVHDVKAVNAFIADGKSDASSTTSNLTSTDNSFDCSVYDCDYIEGSTVPNQPAGAFWAVLNRLLIIFQCIILILSECSWPSQFFSSYFPVLGPSFGLGALGVIQCLLGAAVLSHHVDEFSLVSAFFVFSIGCLNILLGLIFRESVKHKRSIREWKEKEPGTLPTVRDGKVPRFDVSRNVFLDRPVSDEKGAFGAYRSGSLSSQKVGFGFGRQGEKMAANQGYVVREPEESVPPYAAKPISHSKHSSRDSRDSRSSYSESRRQSSHHEEDDEEEDGSPAMTRTNSSATAV